MPSSKPSLTERLAGVADLLRELPKRFGRIGRYHVVDRDRIREVSGASGRYMLFLEGADYPVKLARAMEDDLREYLGVFTLDHQTPIPLSQRVLKEKGLIDFGYLEYLEFDKGTRPPWPPSRPGGTCGASTGSG